MTSVPNHIFRAYDIRGNVGEELTPSAVSAIGQAFANEAVERGCKRVVVAGDVRLSTSVLKNALSEGLNCGGVDVVDIGIVPTPVLYFATEFLETGAGIVVTGSHNPPEFNGLKFVLNRIPFAGGDLQELHGAVAKGELRTGSGLLETDSVTNSYIEKITTDIAIAPPLRVGIDCGNGVTSVIAPQLFSELGCEIHSLYAEPDGTFPNHHPDPVKLENLRDLIELVRTKELDLGVAFDGDGDRLGVVTSKGDIVTADTLMSYFAQDILECSPGASIVFDVKCSGSLSSAIESYGGKPIMWKTGHTNIKQKIRELNAPLGGEFSGHICFADRWYGFDDAMYSAARLFELHSKREPSLDEFLKSTPPRFATPEIEVKTTDARKFEIICDLQQEGSFGDGTVLTIDGLRVDYKDSWGLIRASNTTPNLTMRFEAASESALDIVRQTFLAELAKVAPDLV